MIINICYVLETFYNYTRYVFKLYNYIRHCHIFMSYNFHNIVCEFKLKLHVRKKKV